jgi:hypothetical protein
MTRVSCRSNQQKKRDGIQADEKDLTHGLNLNITKNIKQQL